MTRQRAFETSLRIRRKDAALSLRLFEGALESPGAMLKLKLEQEQPQP